MAIATLSRYLKALVRFRPLKRAILFVLPRPVTARAIVQLKRVIFGTSYASWLRRQARADRDRQTSRTQTQSSGVRFLALVDDAFGAEDTVASLQAQAYPHCVHHQQAHRDLFSGALADVLSAHQAADYVLFLRAGSRLAPDALAHYAAALGGAPHAGLAYGHEDRVDAAGNRVEPFFKPAWSPDLLEAFNYIGHGACIRRDIVAQHSAAESYYDLLLRVTEDTSNIVQVDRVVHSGPASAGLELTPEQAASGVHALEGRLARTARRGTVQLHAGGGFFELRVVVDVGAAVSVIIPTAAKTAQVGERSIDFIVNCVQHIRASNDGADVEIIIVENGDLTPVQAEFLGSAECRLVRYRHRETNIAKKLNAGAQAASKDVLLLLNDDIEVIDREWLARMLQHFAKPHVGVVGAKLLYPNNTVQHAGVVHSSGNPEHVRRYFHRDDPGYFYSTAAPRNFSAVTGACLMTRRDLFERVGGFSETFPLNYNDTDYCLAVRELGYSVVYEPVELYHFESQSRPEVSEPDAHARYLSRWNECLSPDPFYDDRIFNSAPATFSPLLRRKPLP